MKLGILCAIDPHESGVDWSGTPVEAYIRFFQSVDAPFEYAGYYVAQHKLPESIDECDFYVITGSPRGAYDSDPWIHSLIQFIRDAYAKGKKFAGICFGHQVLAQALGGKVIKADKGWGLGLKEMRITARKGWMENQVDSCLLYFAHQDQVITLPPEAELLGGSEFCPVGLYVIDGRVLGVQGHPEFTKRTIASIIDQAKISQEPALVAAADDAALSLNTGQPDNQLLAQWIVDFLLGKD